MATVSSSSRPFGNDVELNTSDQNKAAASENDENVPVNGVQNVELLEEEANCKEIRPKENGQHMSEEETLSNELHNGDFLVEKQGHKSSTETDEEGPAMKDLMQTCQNDIDTVISQKKPEINTAKELKDSPEDDINRTTIKPNDSASIRPQLLQRHSPNSRSHNTGGCHKFQDEEARAEYMKIKSEVTGEAETSESEDEAAAGEHTGSHSSPDAKTKAEYRKIKYEVTGEALTSESEDENAHNGLQKVEINKDLHNEWMDVFGNGLLKRKVYSFHSRLCRGILFPVNNNFF